MHTSHRFETVRLRRRAQALGGAGRLLLVLLAGSLCIGPAQAQKPQRPGDEDLVAVEAFRAEKEAATRIFLDPEMPKEERLRAAANLGYPEPETFEAMLRIGADSAVDEEIRWEALRQHRFTDEYLDVVLKILESPENVSGRFVGDLVENLSRRTTFRLPAPLEQRIRAALRDLLDDPRERVRIAAYRSLIGGRDTVAVNRLVEALDRGEEAVPIPLAEAIDLLDANGSVYHIRTLQPFLEHADPSVQAQAVRALAVDPASQAKIVELALARTTPEAVRSNALRALSREDEAFASYAIDLLADSEETATLRYTVMKAFAGRMNYRSVEESDQLLFARTVEALATDPPLKAESDGELYREAVKLFAYLKEAFPVIRRHYALRAHS